MGVSIFILITLIESFFMLKVLEKEPGKIKVVLNNLSGIMEIDEDSHELISFSLTNGQCKEEPTTNPVTEFKQRFSVYNFIESAKKEFSNSLEWTNATCDAEKYIKPFRGYFGHKKYIPWCGMAVHYVLKKYIKIPLKPDEELYTFALVETWKKWANRKGIYYKQTSKTSEFVNLNKETIEIAPGDIVLYNWDGDKDTDHIGICVQNLYHHNTTQIRGILSAEGNRKNKSGLFERTNFKHIDGIIRIPQSFYKNEDYFKNVDKTSKEFIKNISLPFVKTGLAGDKTTGITSTPALCQNPVTTQPC